MPRVLPWLSAFILLLNMASASHERAIIEENDGKALLIYNIAKFSVWPAGSEPEGAPFTFSLWEDAPLFAAFHNIEGLKAQGHEVLINYHTQDSFPADCKVLVIPKHQLQKFIASKNELKSRPILTVTTDMSVFDAGAMVLVDVVDDRLAFSVNLQAVKASGLEISGNLLRHARKVNF